MARIWTLVGMVWAILPVLHAQPIVSLHSGLLNYAEGHVESTSNPVPRAGSYYLVPGQDLETQLGRAEVLIAPMVFLRLAEDSAVRMVSDSLVDPVVEILRGTVFVDAVDVLGDGHVRIRVAGAEAEIRRQGIFKFTLQDNQTEVQVLEGKLDLAAAGAKHELKKGKQWSGGANTITGFNHNETDTTRRWSSNRALAVAVQNLRMARTTYGDNWRRYTRPWLWSIYINEVAAGAHPQLRMAGL